MTPRASGARSAARGRHCALLSLVLAACSSGSNDDGPVERECSDASARIAGLACVHRLDDEATWHSISVESELVDQVRSAKYMFPRHEEARLPPVFLNAHTFGLHYDFLIEAFPQRFSGLTPKQYLDILFDEEQREFYVGTLTEYRLRSGERQFGFTLSADPQKPETVRCEDVRAVHEGLSERIYAQPLAAVPSDRDQLAWFGECGVPVIDPTKTVRYEAYHRAVGFGTLRRYEAEDLAQAIEQAEFGFQDILVLDEAPSDVETVVSGAITGTRQGPLSHLAVRSASRGTPNCYLADAFDYLAEWEGKLVRIECDRSSLRVREASAKEAQAFWDELRPAKVTIPAPDASYAEIVALRDLPTDTKEARLLAVRRFGAKGENLAWLAQNMDEAFTPKGFLIPLSAYLRFVEQATWEVDLGDGPRSHTFAETVAAWLDDPRFLSDAKLRRDRLLALQEAFEDAECDPDLVSAVGERIVSVFGSERETVRFRSSSNAEDGAFFNGAGLYDSYSGCFADDIDQNEDGPSRCDADEAKERGVCRALKKVWASLWNPRAFDERAFYGVDQASSAMGVVVSERSEDELANMVAFSGNPVVAGDDRYLINAQVGEVPVVSPEPGAWPEQILLTLEGTRVTKLERIGASSELPEGAFVLRAEDARRLGTELAKLARIYPYDAEPPKNRAFMLDTEWKVQTDGSLRIKQVRPFLR